MTPVERALTEHQHWVRALALRLAADPHQAEDLVQETWLQALRQQDSSGVAPREPRRWLARVLRNALLQSHRREQRAKRRERSVARDEAVPSTAELVERLAVQRRVATAVAQLDEPYRTVVLLRFVEGLAASEIAMRLAVPASTVRTRLQRGLERLRGVLDSDHGGDRRAWLLPLLGSGAGVPVPVSNGSASTVASAGSPLASGGLGQAAVWLMNSKMVLVAGAVVLVAVVGAIAWPGQEDAPNSTVQAAQIEGRATEADDRVAAAGPAPGELAASRRAVNDSWNAETDDGESAAAMDERFVPLAGRVVDVSGRRVGEVEVRLRGVAVQGGAMPRTDEQGEFVFSVVAESLSAAGGCDARVETEDWTTVLRGEFSATDAERIPPVLVVAPRRHFGGVVVDSGGAPVEGARLQVQYDEDALRAGLGEVLDRSAAVRVAAQSVAGGAFELDRVAGLQSASLLVTARGLLPRTIELPARSATDLRVELEGGAAQPGALTGMVLDQAGRPAAGAYVTCGRDGVQTDAAGRFVLELNDAEARAERTVRAMLRGYLPVEQTVEWAALDQPTPFLTLQLASKPLRIAGQVVDHRGAPVVGLRVWPNDASPTLGLGRGIASIEGYLGGGATWAELRPLFESGARPDTMPKTARWNWVDTDADGGFFLDGLLPRDYHIAVLDPATLSRTVHGPFRAGAGATNLRIVLPEAALLPVVAGQVVSSDGEPQAGVRVLAVLDAVRLPYPSGQGAATMHHQAETRAVTDAEGRFRLENVAAADAYLRLDADRILPLEYGRGVEGGIPAVEGQPVENLRIVVQLRLHARVELTNPDEADAIAVEDAEGQRLTMDVFLGQGRRSSRVVPLRDGQTPSLALPGSTVNVVLLRGEEEVVRKVPVVLRAGELQVIRI